MEDFAPALEERGALVLYVDLWSDRREDPAVLIARAVATAVSRRKAVLEHLRRIASLEAVSVGAVSLS